MLTANIRMATNTGLGSNGTHNVDFTQWGSNKPFELNLGYLDYKPMAGINLHFGKNPNIFWTPGKTPMVWNADQTFEGLNAKWMGDFGSMKPWVGLSYAQMWDRVNNAGNVASDAANGADVAMFGAQAGLKWAADPVDVTFGVGSYNYNNIKGLPFAGTSGALLGNSADQTVTTAYRYDYKLLNAGLEVGYNLGFAPLTAFFDYVTNSDASEGNNGMLAGFRLGQLKDQGSWTVMYNYRDVARDAVFARVSDTTFLGGQSDVRGHEMQVGYQAWQNAALGLTYSSGNRAASTANYSYEAYYLDLVAAF
jgi:hypothetical protein